MDDQDIKFFSYIEGRRQKAAKMIRKLEKYIESLNHTKSIYLSTKQVDQP